MSRAGAGIEVVTEAVSEPFSVAFDAGGVLYGVEFTKANRIFRVVNGQTEFVAGICHDAEKKKPTAGEVGDGADPLAAKFHGMHDIQITPDGRAIIADSFHHRVRALDLRTGTVSTLAGTEEKGFAGDGGAAAMAQFNSPMTATLSPDGRRICVADIGNHRIREIDLAAGIVRTVAGDGRPGAPDDGANALEAPFGDARAVTQAPDGTLYVLLRRGSVLIAIRDGKVRTAVNASGKRGYAGDGGPGRDALLDGPKYLAMDCSGRVLICDTENHCIRRFDPATGIISLVAGKPPEAGAAVGATWSETALCRPHGARLGPDGLLYIADSGNGRILRGEYH